MDGLTSNGQTCSFTQQQTDALTMKKWDSTKNGGVDHLLSKN